MTGEEAEANIEARDRAAAALLRERHIWPDRCGRYWNFDREEACYHTQTPQQALRSHLPDRYAEVYESAQVPAHLIPPPPPVQTVDPPQSGADLGRYYTDLYSPWVEHADRDGDLLFVRYGTHFVTFGEHATIVAEMYSQSAYTTPLGGGEPIGPIYALANPTIAEHTMTILRRQGHGIAILHGSGDCGAVQEMEATQ